MEFSFVPNVGALPITFEMRPGEVKKIIGPPKNSSLNSGEKVEFRWSKEPPKVPLRVCYSPVPRRVVAIEFDEGSVLNFKGVNLFEGRNIVKLLSAEDQPKCYLGAIIFLKLGVSMVGFDDDEDVDKNITVFRKGRWDNLLDKLQDLTL